MVCLLMMKRHVLDEAVPLWTLLIKETKHHLLVKHWCAIKKQKITYMQWQCSKPAGNLLVQIK